MDFRGFGDPRFMQIRPWSRSRSQDAFWVDFSINFHRFWEHFLSILDQVCSILPETLSETRNYKHIQKHIWQDKQKDSQRHLETYTERHTETYSDKHSYTQTRARHTKILRRAPNQTETNKHTHTHIHT